MGVLQEIGKAGGRNHGVGHEGERAAPLNQLHGVGRHRVAGVHEESPVALVVQQHDGVQVDPAGRFLEQGQPLFGGVSREPVGQGRLDVDRHRIGSMEQRGFVIHEAPAVDAEILQRAEARQAAGRPLRQGGAQGQRRGFRRQREEQVEPVAGRGIQLQDRLRHDAEDSLGADDQVEEIQAAVRGGPGAAGVFDGRPGVARHGDRHDRAVGPPQFEEPVFGNILTSGRSHEEAVRRQDIQLADPAPDGAGLAGNEAGGVAGEATPDGGVGPAGGIDREEQPAVGLQQHPVSQVLEDHADRRQDGAVGLVHRRFRQQHAGEGEDQATFRRGAAGQVGAAPGERDGNAGLGAGMQDQGGVRGRGGAGQGLGPGGQVGAVRQAAVDDVGIQREVNVERLPQENGPGREAGGAGMAGGEGVNPRIRLGWSGILGIQKGHGKSL